ncbi:cystatin-F [Gracilinanus agilis]|uniref:cystatin-F n=1 Tax=Gracilinanus agilis TaxID=191870 RepID=UPI001CFE2B6F|nr:cystatin-F [Gracilinanus agilis]
MRTAWSWLIFCHLTLADLASASRDDECLPCVPLHLDVPKHAKWITKEKCWKQGGQVHGYHNSSGLYAGKKPGLPKVIKPSDPGVQKAARFAVERFNNCTNDLFLFKELHIDEAMVQNLGLHRTLTVDSYGLGLQALLWAYTDQAYSKLPCAGVQFLTTDLVKGSGMPLGLTSARHCAAYCC